ncbi:MAG: 4-coumarate--CoA ligase family protein, partial [Chloroflexi bacterium]|nr:4-coumarate--CoA ligase family protein [Chloroflexota bacterium]
LGDKPALVDASSGRTLSYGQLAADVRRVAAGLAARGFGKGDVLGLYSPNLPEYAVVFHAVAILGGITTTVNPLYTADELARQLNDCHARLLVTVPSFLERALAAAGQVPTVRDVIVIGEADRGTAYADLLSVTGEPPAVDIDPAVDLIALPYSSGTTGLPKGVMLTHQNLVANVLQTLASGVSVEQDVGIAVLPFYHIYGMVVVMGVNLAVGATVVTMPRFELEPFLRTLQDAHVTKACLVPPIVLALAKHPAVDNYDLSSLERVLSGAAPMSMALEQACAARLGVVVSQGYGMTETSPVTHISPAEPALVRAGTVGLTAPNTETRIVDVSTGEDVGPDETGEIWVRGPQVMKGYLNHPQATADMLDADGWLRTGDIGSMDADGYLTIVDRLKELIKYKGLQVAPAELEALLLSHPDVADAAVIPIPDEEAGEVPKAFVVRRTPVMSEELMAFVAERVAPHKRIRQLTFVDAIPKSASGKILRRVLVDQERGPSS